VVEYLPKNRGGTDRIFNPNLHCFIAITKAAAVVRKDQLLPHPLPKCWRGAGRIFT
jgi:hypothetical protein